MGESQNTNPEPKTSPAHNNTVLNHTELTQVWGKQVVLPAELFQTVTQIADQTIVANTHWIVSSANEIKPVPYNDELGPNQSELKKLFKPGEIGIAIKHHLPNPREAFTEQIKLQCTHIEVVVGVEDGVITVNNPQDYQNGLFGAPDYPMIFIKPEFPQSINEGKKKEYIQNMRTWLVIANQFTVFPGDYNGSDPLTCTDKSKILKMGNALIGALLNNPEDLEWLNLSEQNAYCAELAFLALNLGLHFPLNKKYLGTSYDLIKTALDKKEFLSKNQNPYIAKVDLSMAAEELTPIDTLISLPVNEKFWSGLAITPFSVADMIEQYIQRIIPRSVLGEEKGSKLQSIVFEQIKPNLKNFLKIENTDAESKFDEAVNQISDIVKTNYGSYHDFRAALLPVFKELEDLSLTYGLTYIPPHSFLTRASDFISKQQLHGVLGWSYVGHGLHSSLLKTGVNHD